MRYIVKWIFLALLGGITGLLGSSRREEKRVDPNKTVMRQQPLLRYAMYAVGIMLIGLFVFVGTMAVNDGAQKEEPWIILFLIIGILVGVLCFCTGYVLYAKHVFFDEEGLIVGRPFRKNLHVKWQEIDRMEKKGNRLILYGADKKKLVKADPALENYDLFESMAKRMCSAKMAKDGGEWKNGECVIRRSAAAYAMYGLVVFLLLSTAGIALLGGRSLADLFTKKGSAAYWVVFSLAAAVLLYGIWLHMEKIRYTRQEISFCNLFSKKTFEWRRLEKIRRAVEGQNGIEKLYLTWDRKEYAVSSLQYRNGYAQLLDFVIEVALEQNVPSQNL